MPNFTPGDVRRLYDIYPGKAGCDLTPQRSVAAVEQMVTAMGRWVDYARGDALRLTRAVQGGNSPREASSDAGLAKALYN